MKQPNQPAAGFIALKPGFIIWFLAGLAAGIFVGMVLSALSADEATKIDQLQPIQNQAEETADQLEQVQDRAEGVADDVNQIIDRVNPGDDAPGPTPSE